MCTYVRVCVIFSLSMHLCMTEQAVVWSISIANKREIFRAAPSIHFCTFIYFAYISIFLSIFLSIMEIAYVSIPIPPCPIFVGIELISIPPLVLSSHVRIMNERWLYSLQKIHVFSLEQYARILFLDGDTILVKNLHAFFGRGEGKDGTGIGMGNGAEMSQIMGVVDTYDGCDRRDVITQRGK